MSEFPDITRFDVVAIDTETTGLDWNKDRVFGVAISTPDGNDYYWDVRKEPQVWGWLQDQLPKVKRLVNHHIKFDIHMLRQCGVDLMLGRSGQNDRIDCTMMLGALIDEHLFSYSLDSLAFKYLGKNKDTAIYEDLATLFGGKATKDAQMPNLHKAPPELVARYAKVDSRLALELWHWQQKEITHQGLEQICDFERSLFPYIVEMETKGIQVDVERAETTLITLTSKIDILSRELNKMAGFEVNYNPSGSIIELFKPKLDKARNVWVANDGTVLDSTEGGKPSITAEALERMVHPAAIKILEARKLAKARDTFITKHVLERLVDGRVYPNINQTKGDVGHGTEGTGTGRMSYTGPAMQQIPSRDKLMASIIRPIFLPDDGFDWSYGDLDQHEYRVFVHYAKPASVIAAYKENPNLDFHQKVADLTGLPRSAQKSGGANAKQLNLGMVFSMGGGALAYDMGLPYYEESVTFDGESRTILRPGEEAKAVIEEYHRQVPGIRETARKATSIAKSRGYVKTIMGRRIRFPGGKFTHKAAGLVYQGSSADLNKDNIMRLADVVREVGGRVILNIHDEYSLAIPKDIGKERSTQILKDCQRVIQHRPELRVPIRIDFSAPSDNWWYATKAKKVT